jgi:putative tricarboxylic transport membrane protein
MNRANQVAAVAFLLLAFFIMSEAVRLRYYTSLGPGPGFFPLWLGLCLGVLSLLMLVGTIRRPQPASEKYLPTGHAYPRMAVVVVSIGASAVLMQPVGFPLTMLGVLLAVLFGLGRDYPIIKLLLAAIGSFGLHHAFVHWLHIPLPRGLFSL